MLTRRETRDVLLVSMTATAVVAGMLATQYTGYQLGFATAKNLVEESPLGAMLQTPSDIRFVVGTVIQVRDDRLTLRTNPLNPFDTLRDRTVLVASSTRMNTKDLAGIKVGETLFVTAAENIASLATFTAQIISVQASDVGSVTTVTVDEE